MEKTLNLGQILITANALESLDNDSILPALLRHRKCDWGESSDKKMNDAAVEDGNDRVVSVYRDSKGKKFWIITEADRSATTVLLPEDY